jgi:hypothetical protein
MLRHGVKAMRLVPVKRSYAFEDPAIPSREQWVIKVRRSTAAAAAAAAAGTRAAYVLVQHSVANGQTHAILLHLKSTLIRAQPAAAHLCLSIPASATQPPAATSITSSHYQHYQHVRQQHMHPLLLPCHSCRCATLRRCRRCR